MAIALGTKVRVKPEGTVEYAGQTGVVDEDITPWDYPYLVVFADGGFLYYAEDELEVIA
jgi:hypothetical protein